MVVDFLKEFFFMVWLALVFLLLFFKGDRFGLKKL